MTITLNGTTGITTTGLTSTGIDDNATSTAITIDSSQNVGVGTASPDGTFHVKDAIAQVYIQSNDGQPSQVVFGDVTDASGGMIEYTSSNDMTFKTNNLNERMRIDSSGNVGIGLTPENSNGTWRNFEQGGMNLVGRKVGGVDGMIGTNYVFKTDNSEVYKYTAATSRLFFDANEMLFQQAASGTAGTAITWSEAMRINSSGNVGIGTASPSYKLHVSQASSGALVNSFADDLFVESSAHAGITIGSGATSTGNLAFTDSGNNFVGYVQYNHGDNSMRLGSNASEAMRIDSSGNVGIGTTSPFSTARLQVKTGTNLNLAIQTGTTETSGMKINAFNDAATANIPLELNGSVTLLKTGETERMRVDSSGNVGIGESAPQYKLDINGANTAGNVDVAAFTNPVNAAGTGHGARILIHSTQNPSRGVGIASVSRSNYAADNAMAFYTSASSTLYERMRIDNSGNLLVGTTTSIGSSTNTADNFTFSPSSGYAWIAVSDSGGVYIQRQNDGNVLTFYRATANAGSISIDAVAPTTNYNTTSDQRLKENIIDAPAGNIDAIRVRSFDWKESGAHQNYGMIAQELVAVAPEAVTQGETEEDMWSVDYSKLVPMMIKEIQDLRARVAQLEGA